jgi:methyl-accepting chemotaxis protein
VPRYPFLSNVLKVTGFFGFFIHIAAAILVIIVRPMWVGAINDFSLEVLDEVEGIRTIISMTEESLSQASITLSDTSDLLLETGEFIQDSNLVLRSVGGVIGEEAPTIIQSTHDALEAAQSGSKAVDTMLKGLSILEPVTGFSYDPEKSLSQSLEEVADGLEPLPETLREIQRQLNQVADKLDEVHPSLEVVTKDLNSFSESVAELSSQVKSQEERLSFLPGNTENFIQKVAAFGRISTIIVCVFLVLGAISYLSVFRVGNQMRTGQHDQSLP